MFYQLGDGSEAMEELVIEDGNKFVQCFKQLAYIQDRKEQLEKRNDGFYFFEVINNYEESIGRLREDLVQAFGNLVQLYEQHECLSIWRRMLQRLRDIMEVSKIEFPFTIDEDFFGLQDNILVVLDFLGKKDEDGGKVPEELKRRAKRNTIGVPLHSAESFSGKITKEQDSEQQIFKGSNEKYLKTYGQLQSTCMGAMYIDPSSKPFEFNYNKPLSYNLSGLYSNMMSRNGHVQETINAYLKSLETLEVLRRVQAQTDIAKLELLQAKSQSGKQQNKTKAVGDPVGQDNRGVQTPVLLGQNQQSSELWEPKQQLGPLKNKLNTAHLKRNSQSLSRFARQSESFPSPTSVKNTASRMSQFLNSRQSCMAAIQLSEFNISQHKGVPTSNTRKSFSRCNLRKKTLSQVPEVSREVSSPLSLGIVVRKTANIHLTKQEWIPSYHQFARNCPPTLASQSKSQLAQLRLRG